MPSLKAIKKRIGSVRNTQQITRAMKLVAAAKMKRAVDNAVSARPYSDEVTSVMRNLMARIGTDAGSSEHPLLRAHAEQKSVAIVVLTGDRGLCGAFNNGLLRKVDRFLWEHIKHRKDYDNVEVHVFGKKSRDFFMRRTDVRVARAEVDLNPRKFDDLVARLVHELVSRYEETSLREGNERGADERTTRLDEVYLAYNRFVNTLSQVPTIEPLFPLTALADQAAALAKDDQGPLADVVYEPSEAAVLRDILPLFLRTRLRQVFLESEAGEHAARMTAMDSATRNARDVLSRLTLEYNRARQAAITRELVEIVAGAEAL